MSRHTFFKKPTLVSLIAWQQADSRIAQAEAEFAAAEIALLLRVAERYFEVLDADSVQALAVRQKQLLQPAF